MSPTVSNGDYVYVPVARVAKEANAPFAMARGIVVGQSNRTLTVDLPAGIGRVEIASSAVHSAVGVCIIRIGDFETEETLLDPIGKSVLQYFRLLIPDDQLRYLTIRTKEELYAIYSEVAATHSHIVLAGHGSNGALHFCNGQSETGDELARNLGEQFAEPRLFVCLCCHAGGAKFAKSFSRGSCCNALIAPFGALHGAVSSQFVQTLFCHHFLEGKTFKVAFKKARKSVPGGTTFRIWQNGKFEGRR
jgi:hypothetical protein